MNHPDIEFTRRTETLIEALPYIQRFRGETFVIKYGGSAMEDEAVVDRLLRDIVFLEAVGINPVLVHGGGKAITRKLADAGIASRFVNGLRVTDGESIRIVREILDNVVNPRIVETINGFGGVAKGFSGTGVFRATRLPEQVEGGNPPVDIGYVGGICGVEIGGIRADIEREIVSVVSPLAVEPASGDILNVNADLAAAALAIELRASKMVYLSDVLGILRDPSDPGSLVPSASRADIDRMVAGGVLKGGMLPKVRSACDAISRGVGKVHFIDGRIPHALLLEVFTDAGVGTEILG